MCCIRIAIIKAIFEWLKVPLWLKSLFNRDLAQQPLEQQHYGNKDNVDSILRVLLSNYSWLEDPFHMANITIITTIDCQGIFFAVLLYSHFRFSCYQQVYRLSWRKQIEPWENVMNHPLHHIKSYKAIFMLKALYWIFFSGPTYPRRILFKCRAEIMVWVTPRSLSCFQSLHSISAPCEGEGKHCYGEGSCSNWARRDYSLYGIVCFSLSI